MNFKNLEAIKGQHPGIFLHEEFQKRNITLSPFALSINEYPSSLGAIINGKRSMNAGLAIKIEEALGLEEGFLMILQVFYDYNRIRKNYDISKNSDIIINQK